MNENTISYKLDRIKNATDRMRTRTGVVSGVIEDVATAVEGMSVINNQNKTITRNGTYNADEGYTGLGTVNVNVEPVLGTKSITENRTYNAGDDNLQGYSSVEVNVSPSVMEKNITSNGEFVSQNDGVDGYNIVRVNVEPLLGTKTVTANGTYNAGDDMVQGYSSVTVNVPTSGGPTVKSNIYRVTTIAERDAITDMVEGDMCVVHSSNISNATVDSRFKSIVFPATVVLSEAITSQVYSSFRNEDRAVDINIMLETSACRIDIMMEPDYTSIEYTSTDGITYTRTTNIEEIELPVEVSCPYPEEWNDAIGYFIQLGTINFDGIFTYKDNNWIYSKVGISTTPDYVYANKDFYSNTGKNTGTLALNIANTFNDISAKAFAEMQLNYDEMDVEIAPEDCTYYYFHKDNTKLYIVPTKSNGEPLLDTSNVTNMRFMFCNCPNLIAIPLLNTKNVTNMESMFDNCTNLQIVPVLDTSNVTNMNRMFWACKSIKNIPLLNISSITSMRQMFGFCTSLTTVPQFDTSNITDMGEMFDTCTSLTTVPQFNTSNVTKMGSMFANCTSLTTAPSLDTSKVTGMSNMFYGCTSLIDVPSLNTSNVEYMEMTFSDCYSLTTVPLLDLRKVKNMQMIFRNCSNLSDTSLNNIMQSCTNGTSLSSSNKTTKYLGFTNAQKERIKSLSNYSAFISAGWKNS